MTFKNLHGTFFNLKFQKISDILSMYKLETIVEFYAQNEMLEYEHRKKMTHAIIAYFMHFEIWLCRDDFVVIRDLIIKEFPTEDALYYYNPPPNSKTNPKGVLWHRFVNQSTSWRHKLGGVFRNNKKKDVLKNGVTSSPGKILSAAVAWSYCPPYVQCLEVN